MTSFDGFPIHIKLNILSHLPQEDVLKFRYMSSDVSRLATEIAFRSLKLKADERSAEVFESVAQSDHLRGFVRDLRIDTNIPGYEYRRNVSFDFPEPFLDALPSIKCFPRVESLALSFNEYCMGSENGDNQYLEIEESRGLRYEILSTIFLAINYESKHLLTLRSLSIHNLQNFNDKRLTTHPSFNATLANLKALRLFIINESIDHAPENELDLPEVSTFFSQLLGTWLTPATKGLTTLSLFAGNHYFGWLPKLDLRGIHFPALKILAFGNYTFTNDWQADWIGSHGATLKELYLDDCPIIWHRRVNGPLDSEGYPPQVQNEQEYDPITVLYETRWAWFLTEWTRTLTELCVFAMGCGDGWIGDGRMPALEYEDMGKSDLRHHKYMGRNDQYLCQYKCFNIGIGPTPWIAKPRGDATPRVKAPGDEEVVWEEDSKALELLLAGVDSRIGKST